eukprot:10149923-Karenia_brevis.AAC.1
MCAEAVGVIGHGVMWRSTFKRDGRWQYCPTTKRGNARDAIDGERGFPGRGVFAPFCFQLAKERTVLFKVAILYNTFALAVAHL